MPLGSKTKSTWFTPDALGQVIEADAAEVVDNIYVFSNVASSTGKVKRIVDGHYKASWAGIIGNGLNQSVKIAALLADSRIQTIEFESDKPQVITITSTVTIPAGKTFLIKEGTTFNGTGKLVFNGSIRADKYQIFGPNISIRINSYTSNVREIYPEWYGAVPLQYPQHSLVIEPIVYGDIDSTIPLQKMFNSLYYFADNIQVDANYGSTCFIVKLNGTYGITDMIDIKNLPIKIIGQGQLPTVGSGFRFCVNPSTTDLSSKYFFRINGSDYFEMRDLYFWGYRSTDESRILAGCVLPCLKASPDSRSQRQHVYKNINFGDGTGFISNNSPEEQAITARYFAMSGIRTEGSVVIGPYYDGNNDFGHVENCHFAYVKYGAWWRQSQAVQWHWKECQATIVNYVMRFDVTSKVFVDGFFMGGFGVDGGFLYLGGTSDDYFGGEFKGVDAEDVAGNHWINSPAMPFNIKLKDNYISFGRYHYSDPATPGDAYILESTATGSPSSLIIDGGSVQLRGDNTGSTKVRLKYQVDGQGVFNLQLKNQLFSDAWSNVWISSPIGVGLMRFQCDVSSRYGAVTTGGVDYGQKKIERLISVLDPLWDTYTGYECTIFNLITENSEFDDRQFNNRHIAIGEGGRSPIRRISVLNYKHTMGSTHTETLSGILPATLYINGVGISPHGSMIAYPSPDRNASGLMIIGDRFDDQRWGIKGVTSNALNNHAGRKASSTLNPVIFPQNEDLILKVFTAIRFGTDACTHSGTTVTSNTGGWFDPADVGKVLEWRNGPLKGLTETITAYISGTQVTTNVTETCAINSTVWQQENFTNAIPIMVTIYHEEGNYNEITPGLQYNWYPLLPSI